MDIFVPVLDIVAYGRIYGPAKKKSASGPNSGIFELPGSKLGVNYSNV